MRAIVHLSLLVKFKYLVINNIIKLYLRKLKTNLRMKLIKTIKTVSNIIYIYEINNNLFAFKPSKNSEKEILANKLANLFGIKTLETKPVKIGNCDGILMNYLENSTLLTNYKNKLNKNQMKQLKKIILFDIWICNKDRHTANVFINNDLIIFDHDNIFQDGDARKFIKLDMGRKLNKNYVDIIENLLDKDLTAVQVLKKLGFTHEDFIKIKDEDIKDIVKDNEILKLLISRKVFDNIKF